MDMSLSQSRWEAEPLARACVDSLSIPLPGTPHTLCALPNSFQFSEEVAEPSISLESPDRPPKHSQGS